MTAAYELIGATASPYSVKMRAILRYRRIPHVWRLRHFDMQAELAQVKPPVMPYLRYPDGSLRNDSTPLAYDLEERHPGERSILPPGPGRAFLSHLIEDMADEWGTRIMAYHRWNHERDRTHVTRWAGREMFRGNPDQQVAAAQQFRERQTGRLDVLGAHPDNQEIVEKTYRSVLAALQSVSTEPGFMFGSRPALADFGWFGQLFQCASDPTASTLMREDYPEVFIWLLWMDDASGIEGAWLGESEELPEGTLALLQLAGDFYLPYLVANAVAARRGDTLMQATLLDAPVRQEVSRYQVKCLEWLRAEWNGLPAGEQAKVMPVLTRTGCTDYLTSQED